MVCPISHARHCPSWTACPRDQKTPEITAWDAMIVAKWRARPGIMGHRVRPDLCSPVNSMLAVGRVLIVLIFRTSDALAAAYGIAVDGVMVISTFLVGIVAVRSMEVEYAVVIAVFGTLGLVDLTFLSAEHAQDRAGGWLPLAMAAMVFVRFDTWRVGRRVHSNTCAKILCRSISSWNVLSAARVAGTRDLPGGSHRFVPGPLLHSLKHTSVMHERVVLASTAWENVSVCAIGGV